MKCRITRRSAITATFAAVMALSTLAPVAIQSASAAPADAAKPVVAKMKSRTESRATVAAVTADSLQITTKQGAVDAALTPQTEYWRLEDNLKPEELKVGDMVAFALRSTDGQPTVASVAPLTLKFGDDATLTLNKTDRMTFDRLTAIKSSDVAVGQNVAVKMNVLPDGKFEAQRVTVVVAKPKATKAPKTPKAG
jgi:Cu/Ag efflux protein CusF